MKVKGYEKAVFIIKFIYCLNTQYQLIIINIT